MKIRIVNYTFDKVAQTITFLDYASILLDQVLLIANVTTSKPHILYNFADPTAIGTVATNVFTLNSSIDTSQMANTDKLLIYYDDPDASLNQSLSTLLAGEDLADNVQKVEQQFSYIPIITTQTTTVVKSGAGFLHTIIIPTPVANATIDIYDNTAASGSKIIPTITLPATLLNDGPLTVIVNAKFALGLTIVTGGATMGVGGSFR